MNRIVVGIDGSENSRAALRWAIDEASLRDATLEAVLVWHEQYYGGTLAAPVPVDFGALETSYQADLATIVSGADAPGLQSPIVETVRRGSTSGELLAAAEDADLLVVGSRGHGGFLGLLLGSVSHQVAAHAPCPVVIVPAVD